MIDKDAFERFVGNLSDGPDTTDEDMRLFEQYITENNPEITVRLLKEGVKVKSNIPDTLSVPVMATAIAGIMYDDMNKSVPKEERVAYIYEVFGFILNEINKKADAEDLSEVLS